MTLRNEKFFFAWFMIAKCTKKKQKTKKNQVARGENVVAYSIVFLFFFTKNEVEMFCPTVVNPLHSYVCDIVSYFNISFHRCSLVF